MPAFLRVLSIAKPGGLIRKALNSQFLFVTGFLILYISPMVPDIARATLQLNGDDCIPNAIPALSYKELVVSQDTYFSEHANLGKRGNVRVHVLDGIVWPHEDLADSLRSIFLRPNHDLLEIKDPSKRRTLLKKAVADADREIKRGCFSKGRDHATHIAGIIASTGRTSHYAGLYPNSQIISHIETNYTTQEVIDLVTREGNSGSPLKVFLFASDFTNRGKDAVLIENAITSANILWVTAAGQSLSEDGNPELLTDSRAPSPMKLGRAGNILVVTACNDSCLSDSPRIMKDSNYAPYPGHVHLAAPGNKIPGLTVTSYAYARGTSQAAAYVSGIAARMIGSFPSYYVNADQVKVRIIASANPNIQANSVNYDMENKIIDGGIVDPSMAEKDPTVTWLKESGSIGGKSFNYTAVTLKRWCGNDDDVRLLPFDPFSKRAVVDAPLLKNIIRIRKAPSVSLKGSNWMIWYRPLDHGKSIKGGVTQVGPVSLYNPSKPEPAWYKAPLAVVEEKNGGKIQEKSISLDKIDDLLIAGIDGFQIFDTCQ